MNVFAVRRNTRLRLLVDASVWIAAETPGEHFEPAARDGKTVEGIAEVPILFRLEN